MAIFEQILNAAGKLLTTEVVLALSLMSVIMIIASVLALPPILCRLPHDYFDHEKPHLLQRIRSSSPGKAVMLVAKNFAGVILITAGILMLFLPGQGMLTILIGIVLTDFPGKYRIERHIASNPKILAAINWLRRKHGRPDMIITRY